MRRYFELLRAPGVAPLVAATTVGRLPYGMNVLALILLLRSEGFGYAEVGLVTGAAGLAVGLTAPALGRLIDRLGQTRVLAATSVACLATNTSVVVAALSGVGVVPLTALALLAGGSTPPVSPSMRTLWPELVGRDRLDTAFAFDALQLEIFFIGGPLLAAGLAAWISPEVAVLTGTTMQAAGALAFAATPASREWRPSPDRELGRRGALRAPGIRVLVAAMTAAAVSLGVGSLAGGLWYGARTWRIPPERRFLVVSGVLALGLAPLPLAESMSVFAVLVVVAGLGLAPSTAASYSLIGDLAPPGATTEAYAWQIVAYVAGSSVGAWLAGAVVEAAGVETALACAPAFAAAGLLIALSGRRSLAARLPR